MRLVRIERPLVVGLDAPVELERRGSEDRAVLDGDEHRRTAGAILDVGEPSEIAVPIGAAGGRELAIRERGHVPGLLELLGRDLADLEHGLSVLRR